MSSITKTPQYVENVNRGYGEHWTNPDNVKTSDDGYATATAGKTDWLEMQDFDFAALPDTAKIVGAEVAIHCKGFHVKDDQVYLAYEGTAKGSNRAGCERWKNNENIHILGSSSDTWGWSLTPAIVKSQWFGINFCARAYDSAGGTAYIDYVTLTIYYENKTSIEDICNDALSIIGEPAITDIDGTDSRSKICKLNYGSVCKRLLGAHDWLFASYRVQLNFAYNCPLFGWAYVYELPSNFLRMLETYPLEVAYELGAPNKIYMNEGTGYIKYIASVDDPALFDINFRTALVYKLALVLHPCLVDKATSRQVLQREAQYEIIRAISQGTIHQKHTKPAINWTSEMRI
jgi:hypothetical protein